MIPSEPEETECHICGARVPAGWGMDAHLESFKPVVGLDVQCERCGEAFIEYRALRQVCARVFVRMFALLSCGVATVFPYVERTTASLADTGGVQLARLLLKFFPLVYPRNSTRTSAA